jgi:hypothetical protein
MSKPTVTIEMVTPALAHMWLSGQARNRSVNEKRVAYYASKMSSGSFVLSWDAIAFNSAGQLINGQHRLLAIVSSEVNCQMLVATGLDKIRDGDRPLSRTLANDLQITFDQENANRVAAVATIIRSMCNGTWASGQPYTSAGDLDLFIVPELSWAVSESHRVGSLKMAPVVSMLAVARICDSELAERLASGLVKGEGLSGDSPMYRARNHIICGKSKGEGQGNRSFQLMLSAWAAEKERRRERSSRTVVDASYVQLWADRLLEAKPEWIGA